MKRVVIIGGGFAGLYAAKALGGSSYDVTLVDRRNFHLFQPLLYQVATGGLSPGEIASPLRYILKRYKNIRVLMAEVTDIDIDSRTVHMADDHRGETEAGYEVLIVAAGARHHYFGRPEWEQFAPGLKTIEDATEIRGRILRAFEAAERETDSEKRRAWLTFVVAGGGPTGVELAGALGEIANDTLRHDFRSINPAEANILLFEGSGRVLNTFPESLSEAAERSLIKLGVRSRGGLVTNIDAEGVTVKTGQGEIRIATRTVLWAAGVVASPLAKSLAAKTGTPIDKIGRLMVEPDFTLPGHPEILALGDMANYPHQTGQALPGVAPVAMQAGRYAARLLRARLKGETLAPFRYVDKGNMATIGRAAAVGEVFGFRLKGWIAWLLWLFIHIMYLAEFDNRLLVLTEWAYNYVTRNRGARLITGGDAGSRAA